MFNMEKFLKNEHGDLATVAIGITIFLVVVGYILAPVGLTAMESVNETTAGVATGNNANIWNALVPLTLAALIIGVVYSLKNQS